MKPEIRERYAKNPQFYVRPAKDCEMMFAMSQTGGRLPKDGRYYKYPFKEVLNFANVSVFTVPEGVEHLQRFEKKSAVFISPVKRERENAGRLKLKAGQGYVIIPSCDAPGTEGEVYLSVYLSCALRDASIKRVFHPQDKNTAKDAVLPYLIPEEAEKISSRVPPWKLELVRESLKYVITDEDAGAAANTYHTIETLQDDEDAEASPARKQTKAPLKRPRPKYVEADDEDGK